MPPEKVEKPFPLELRDRWDTLCKNYHNQELHDEFINFCLVNDRVDAALEHYSEERKKQPDNPDTNTALNKISTLMAYRLEPQKKLRPLTGFLKYIVYSLLLNFAFALVFGVVLQKIYYIMLGLVGLGGTMALRWYLTKPL